MTASIIAFRRPDPPAKTAPDRAGPFAFAVLAATDVIDDNPLSTVYREELVVVDPDATIEDDCLVVFQFAGGRPHTSRCWHTGRDHRGRFVPAGDRRECFLTDFGFRFAAEEDLRIVRILGRVVDQSRRLLY